MYLQTDQDHYAYLWAHSNLLFSHPTTTTYITLYSLHNQTAPINKTQYKIALIQNYFMNMPVNCHIYLPQKVKQLTERLRVV